MFDRLGEGAKSDTALLERGDGLDEMTERTAEAVEAPHDDSVSRARVFERAPELRALGERPTSPVAEDALAAGSL